MVSVVCDTSFLIHVANTRIKNAGSIETEIGRLDYAVPAAVLDELGRLSHDMRKGPNARAAIRYADGLERLDIAGAVADDAILNHIRRNGGFVATMDRELKRRIKESGGSIVSIHNDRIVLEG